MLQYFEVINEFGKQGHSRQNYLYYYFSIMHATRKKDLQRKPQMCGNAFKCRLLGDAHALMDAIPIPIFLSLVWTLSRSYAKAQQHKLTLKSLAILTFYMFAFDTFCWKYEVWEKIWYADEIYHFNFRLNPLITPPVEKSPIMTLSLQEVLIVGSCSEQVKFSELTLDMFRMLQSLEREPQEDMVQMYDASPAPGRIPYVRKEWLVLLLFPLNCCFISLHDFHFLSTKMGAEFLAILRIDYYWGIIMVYAYFRRMEVWFWRGRILTSIFCTNRLCLNSSSFWLVATGNCQPTEHSWSTYQGTDAFPQNHKLKIQGCTSLAPKVLWKNWLFYRLWVAGILLQSIRRGKSLHMKKVAKMLNDFFFPATI